LYIFISVASVLLGDGGEPSESSSELLYCEDHFLEIGSGSVYFKTVALAAAYLACMSILNNKFGLKIAVLLPHQDINNISLNVFCQPNEL
jgi:hypothetical protein